MIDEQETICSRGTTFSWLLNLDSMLMVWKYMKELKEEE
jgi:hypothetical protein